MTHPPSVVVTGLGAFCSLGSDVDAMADGLFSGREGVRSTDAYSFSDASPVWAGLAPLSRDESWNAETDPAAPTRIRADRTARLAARAVGEALADAGLAPLGSAAPSRERVGLVLGTSHGGRSQIDACLQEDGWDDESAERLVDGAAHQAQTVLVARQFDVRGPVFTTSTACSSGGNAIGTGLDLLRSGKADVVVAGGADAFSKLTYAGFDALGAMADGPCAPFSTTVGMSLGEGAGIVVLETRDHAAARNADTYATLQGYGLSWDAYHATRPHPNGAGLYRALRRALAEADLPPDALDYVNLHGTGTSANDVAESRAIEQMFDDTEADPPPASSLKSQTGHTLGAAAALGFVASVLAMQNDTLPPTLHFDEARSGCTLDYVPNDPRPAEVDRFASNSSAFGGVNAVLVGGPPDDAAPEPVSIPRVGVTGLGVVSPLGHDPQTFREGLRAAAPAVEPSSAHDIAVDAPLAPVDAFDARRLMPHLRLRRQNPVVRYVSVATGLALEDAGHPPAAEQEEIGLVVGTTRGAVRSYETFIESVDGEQWERARASAFTNLVMSSIGGSTTVGHKLQGVASTVVAGTTSGLQALAHGVEMLRRNPEMDTVVVTAGDEISPLYHDMIDRRGRLSDGPLRPYAPDADGMVLGEGAAAVVLERLPDVTGDGSPGSCYAGLSGYGLACDSGSGLQPDADGSGLARAVQQAARDAGDDRPDVVYGHGRGLPHVDQNEVDALRTLRPFLPADVPVGCVNGTLGVAEAASGLYSVVAALLSLTHDEAYPVATDPASLPDDVNVVTGDPVDRRCRRAVVMGGTEYGTHAAVVLDRPAQ